MRKYLLLYCAALPTPAFAQNVDDDIIIADERISDTAITVVGTGLEIVNDAGTYPVSVIGDDEIRAVQGQDVTRVLQRLPGVTYSRNGGQGGFTGVRVRGAASEQVLVLVDGVRVNDPASPGGGYDFGNLSAGAIGKVELLRGAHSVVWGSDALAGVMDLTTRTVDGVVAEGEYGGDDQLDATASAGLSRNWGTAGLTAGYLTRAGFSALANGTEADGFEHWNVAGRGRLHVADGAALTGAARYAFGKLDIDGYLPDFTLGDTDERQETREVGGRIGGEYDRGDTQLRAGVTYSRTARELFDTRESTDPNFRSVGETTRIELFGKQNLASVWTLDYGADYQWNSFTADSAFAADAGKARIGSGHALLTYDGGGLTLSGGARYDHHSRFGGETSLGASGRLELGGGLAARASYGEGFKAPTLFQLLSDYGNGVLRPERSRSYDLGLAWSPVPAFDGEVSVFRRDSTDLIDFNSCFGVTDGICTDRPFGTYDNIGKARANGLEVSFRARPIERFQLAAAYSYVRSEDRTTGAANRGNDLARRPRHALTLSADGEVAAIAVGADVRMVGDSFDDAANATRLDGYTAVDLRANRPVIALASGHTLDIFGRVENVFDERYQTAAGYATQGRAAFIGLRFGL